MSNIDDAVNALIQLSSHPTIHILDEEIPPLEPIEEKQNIPTLPLHHPHPTNPSVHVYYPLRFFEEARNNPDPMSFIKAMIRGTPPTPTQTQTSTSTSKKRKAEETLKPINDKETIPVVNVNPALPTHDKRGREIIYVRSIPYYEFENIDPPKVDESTMIGTFMNNDNKLFNLNLIFVTINGTYKDQPTFAKNPRFKGTLLYFDNITEFFVTNGGFDKNIKVYKCIPKEYRPRTAIKLEGSNNTTRCFVLNKEGIDYYFNNILTEKNCPKFSAKMITTIKNQIKAITDTKVANYDSSY